jgi:hypothetical protein
LKVDNFYFFKIYQFKNLQVKAQTFGSDDAVKRDLKLVFDNSSEVHLLPDDSNFAPLDHKFESIDSLISKTFQRVNLLAVVNSVGDIECGTAVNGRFWCKRVLNVQDPSVEAGVNLQVWGPDVISISLTL